jgi:hypothetical protein
MARRVNEYTEYDYESEQDAHPTFGEWLANLSPAQHLGYGCFLIVVLGALTLFCGGTASMLARPLLVQREPTATRMPAPTRAPSATQAPPTILVLPTGRVPATPTQAPIPTREPTATPTLVGDMTGVPITNTLAAPTTGTPIRRLTGTVVPKP